MRAANHLDDTEQATIVERKRCLDACDAVIEQHESFQRLFNTERGPETQSYGAGYDAGAVEAAKEIRRAILGVDE